MCEVICPYKDNCTEYQKQCHSCRRNTGRRNYYEPDYAPYYPVNPYPCYPVWYHWEITTGNNTKVEPVTTSIQPSIFQDYYSYSLNA